MPKSYVIDLRHYLTDDSTVPPGLPVPAMTIAYFCGAVVAWVSGWPGWPGSDGELTNVPYRRSRSRTPRWSALGSPLTTASSGGVCRAGRAGWCRGGMGLGEIGRGETQGAARAPRRPRPAACRN